MSRPITDRANMRPPQDLAFRHVRANLNARATVVVPADPNIPVSDLALRYFSNLPELDVHDDVSPGNCAEFLLDGPETYSRMTEDIELTRDGDFIYIAAWWLDPELLAMPTNPPSILARAAARNVELRFLVWNNSTDDPLQLQQKIAWLNLLSHSRAILDDRTPVYGAHHQKLMLVYRGGRLIAYCGGIDVNWDRVIGPKPPFSPGSPLHDVHCRIEGPAAERLLVPFVERWNDHPAAAGYPLRAQTMALGPAVTTKARPIDRHFIAVGQTYVNCQKCPLPTPGKPAYSFAPTGRRSARDLILRAIEGAKRFVYIEDQYFFSAEVGQALVNLLSAPKSTLQHVTVLLTWPAYLLPLMNDQRLGNCIFPAENTPKGNRFRVFYRKPLNDEHTYVHAKVVIVDDEFATIGSTNLNRRSFTYDSEVTVGVADVHTKADVALNFARRLRIALWAQHLGMDSQHGYAELMNGDASIVHWLDLRPESRVVPYNSPTGPGAPQTSVVDAAIEQWSSYVKAASLVMPSLPMTVAAFQQTLKGGPQTSQLPIFDTVIDPNGA